MYLDLLCNGVTVRRGMICLCDVDLLQYRTHNFSGTLFFADMKGKGGIPNYEELGERYVLFYEDEES